MEHHPLTVELGLDSPIRGPTRLRADFDVRLPTAWAGKRLFDVVLALGLLCALLPVFALVALAIKLDSNGPVFYRVRRAGHHGRPLLMLKFRKMHDGARGGPLTVGGDARLTKVGAFLTKSRIDELPQLWDVLRGRMSIIGPRPEDPGFVDLHDIEYSEILAVRPGMTGLSQIAYRAESEIVDPDRPVQDYIDRILPQKLTMDRLYARTGSLVLDLRIIYWTFVTVVLRHPVSVNRVTAAMSLRRRQPAVGGDLAPATVSALVRSGGPVGGPETHWTAGSSAAVPASRAKVAVLEAER